MSPAKEGAMKMGCVISKALRVRVYKNDNFCQKVEIHRLGAGIIDFKFFTFSLAFHTFLSGLICGHHLGAGTFLRVISPQMVEH